jgi:hypothetical protein
MVWIDVCEKHIKPQLFFYKPPRYSTYPQPSKWFSTNPWSILQTPKHLVHFLQTPKAILQTPTTLNTAPIGLGVPPLDADLLGDSKYALGLTLGWL